LQLHLGGPSAFEVRLQVAQGLQLFQLPFLEAQAGKAFRAGGTLDEMLHPGTELLVGAGEKIIGLGSSFPKRTSPLPLYKRDCPLRIIRRQAFSASV
jgi:hypothetical protein